VAKKIIKTHYDNYLRSFFNQKSQ